MYRLFNSFSARSQQWQLLHDISGNRSIRERHNQAVLAVLFDFQNVYVLADAKENTQLPISNELLTHLMSAA